MRVEHFDEAAFGVRRLAHPKHLHRRLLCPTRADGDRVLLVHRRERWVFAALALLVLSHLGLIIAEEVVFGDDR